MAGVMGSFYLGWRYLRHHPGKTTILISSITLIAYLPVGLSMLVDEGAQSLRARAAATPLLLGARGSPVELTLNSLYFSTDTPALTHYAALDAIEPARAQAVIGTVLVVGGALLLADNFGWLRWPYWFNVQTLWPLLLVGLGVGLIVKSQRSATA